MLKMNNFNLAYLIIALFTVNIAWAEGLNGYYGPSQAKTNNTPSRDPFSNSDKMYNEVGIQTIQKANQANYNYQPGAANVGVVASALPKMRLKGLVSKPNQKPTALLELENQGVYYVTAGEEIGFANGGILKIISVSETGIKVQTPQMKQAIVVR